MTTTNDPTTSQFPIGCVIHYAGDLSIPANLQKIKAAGWLLCDGASYAQSAFPALYAAIKAANGGDAANFNVPDLRNRFVRGAGGSTNGRDPDAASRTAANPGGAVGDNVGSLQAGATALPTSNPFAVANAGAHTHTACHLNSDMHMAWSGSTYTMARWASPANTDAGGAHNHSLSGYSSSTMPINVALYFIIKANEPAVVDGATPAGAIVCFGGAVPAVPAGWLACDGMSYAVTRFPNLNAMISYNYGGDGVTVFNTPDLRGNFMRSTSHATMRDPNATQRGALNTGGATGDATGSAQSYATVRPATLVIASGGQHSHNITLVPNQDHHAAWGASGFAAFNCMRWTDDNTTSTSAGDHHHTITGGDKETRPANVYLATLVASDALTSAPPIGSILPIGADTTDLSNYGALIEAGWLPCNGGKLNISDPHYSALYAVIGGLYGSAPLKFYLPDLRGYLVSGAAGAIAVAQTLTVSQTGAPVVAITTSTDGSHNHSMPNIPTDTHVIDVVAGVDLAENNATASPTSSDGAHTHTLTGGDSESRPINVYVDFIIRYK